jgi:TPR repeat protein
MKHREDIDKDFARAHKAWDRGDLKLALSLFQECALLGDSGAQLDLGYFYDTGVGIPVDKKKAYCWYHKAYSSGHFSGASNIAILCKEQGSAKKALWWFRKAATMGDGDAFLELGKCYQKGFGTTKNLRKALVMFQLAVASDNITEYGKEQAQKGIVSNLTRRCSRRITLAFRPFEAEAHVNCNVPIRAGKRARG